MRTEPTFHEQQKITHRYDDGGIAKDHENLSVKEHHRSKCFLEQTNTDYRRKNDMALSRLKMGVSIRPDVPNS